MRLTVQNFRRCRDVQIEGTKPVQLLIGENQEGKTSILGAVVVALTGGQPAWLTKRGESVYDLRREGAKKAEIDLMFTYPAGVPYGLAVHREIAAKAQSLQIAAKAQSLQVDVAFEDGPQSYAGTTTYQQDLLCGLFGLSLKQLSCLLDAGQFLQMDAKEQTAFLAGVSGAELDIMALDKAIEGENKAAAMTLRMGLLSRSVPSGVELLDFCLKWATEERRNAKRVRDEKETLLAVAEREASAKPDGEEPEDVQVRVNDLDARYDASVRRDGEIAQADRTVSEAQEAVASAETALTEAQAQAAPTEALTAAQEKLAPLVQALEAAKDAETTALDVAATSGARSGSACDDVKLFSQMISAGRCPTCRRDWGEGGQDVLDGVVERATEADRQFEADKEILTAAKAAVTSADAAAKAVRQEVANLEAQVQTVEQAVKLAELTLGSRRAVVAQGQQARAALADPEPVEAIQAEFATLQAWHDWKASQETLANLGTTISEQEKTVETWEWLVSKFGSGPGSYRSELLEGKLGALEAAVNEALIDLLDEEIVFPSGDTPLSVKGPGYTRPATRQYLSGSQELRLQIALQYGLCKALGFPLLLVDCEAALDGGTTGEILGFCKNVAASWPGVQMLVAMAPTRTDWREHLMGETERPDGFFGPLPRRIVTFEPWADVWAVVDGKTERLTGGETDE